MNELLRGSVNQEDKRKVTLWDLEESTERCYIQGAKADTPVEVNMDGNPFEIEKIEYEDDGVVRISLKL